MLQRESDQIPDGAPELRDPDERQEILAVFIDELTDHVEAINEAVKMLDFQTLRLLGHTIKGDSMAVGCDEIAKAGASIEEAAMAQNCERIPEWISQVSVQIVQVKKSLG